MVKRKRAKRQTKQWPKEKERKDRQYNGLKEKDRQYNDQKN